MTDVKRKPTVVLCDKLPHGFQHLFHTLRDNVKEYSTHRRELFDTSGNWYLVIDSYNQLLGVEIKDFIIAPGFGHHPDAERIVELAGQRKR